ncbi:MAG: MBL fold metallo-hydrolase [Actinomycetales bacterium]
MRRTFSQIRDLHPTRRHVLFSAGSVLGIAILGTTACSPSESGPAATSSGDGSTPDSSGSGPSGGETGLVWQQASMGFVSAYVLVRAHEAAIVDTGADGSDAQTAIASALSSVGSDWDAVQHIVLTHRHGDHVGGLPTVATDAPSAALYAGADDIAEITAPDGRQLTPLADGTEIFGLQIIGTPGHTPGHVSVFDPTTGVLVAGDALRTTDGLQGSDPQYTADQGAAAESVRKLAQLNVTAILPGHGPPLTTDAAGALSTLADSIQIPAST